jgi:hypothetical protein
MPSSAGPQEVRRGWFSPPRCSGTRHLEVRGTPVPEAAGVQTLLQGAVRRAASDDELLREAEKTFDLLYEAYSDTREVTRG